jgi:hypothetical protein
MWRKCVTMALLWEGYRVVHSDGLSCSWFCETYAAFKRRLRPSPRQSHGAGEKVFVDFAGNTIDVVNPVTGEVRCESARGPDADRRCNSLACGRLHETPFLGVHETGRRPISALTCPLIGSIGRPRLIAAGAQHDCVSALEWDPSQK